MGAKINGSKTYPDCRALLVAERTIPVAVGSLMVSAAYAIFIATLPIELIARGWNGFWIGSAVGSYALGALIFRIFGNNFIDERGPRFASTIALTGLLSTGIVLITIVGLTGPLFEIGLFFARIIQGAAAACYRTAALTFVSETGSEATRGRRIGLLTAIIGIAFLAGPPVGLLLQASPLEPLLWAAPILAALIAFFLRPPGLQRRDKLPRVQLGLIRNATFIGLLSVISGAALIQGGAEAHFPLIAHSLGIGGIIIYLYLAFGLASLISRMIGGFIFDRFGMNIGIVLGTSFLLAALLFPISYPNAPSMLVSAAFLGAGTGILLTVTMSSVGQVASQSRAGFALGTVSLFIESGIVLGAIIFGVGVTLLGPFGFFKAGIAVLVLMISAFIATSIVRAKEVKHG